MSYQSHTMSCILRLVISSDLSFNWYAHFIYSRCRVRVASAEGFPLDYIVVFTLIEPGPWATDTFVILALFFGYRYLLR